MSKFNLERPRPQAAKINVDRQVSKQLYQLIENVVPEEATQHRPPLTCNYIFYNTCVSADMTLEELEATLCLQNHHLNNRYLCTFSEWYGFLRTKNSQQRSVSTDSGGSYDI